jgi:hypothetical protein
MLLPAPLSAYAFTYNNWGATPGTALGTAVTPGASNAEGAWTQIASGANIAQDCYWLHLNPSGGATSANIKDQLLDIGVDPAGGTSYTAIITDTNIGETPNQASTGRKEFLLPFFIKAGSSVAVRVQGSNATAGSLRVAAKFYGQPSHPENCPIGAFSQTFGTMASSAGQAITPGNNTWGSYIDLGAVTKPLWWWQPGYGITNATITAEQTYIEFSYGNASNKHPILTVCHTGTTGETCGYAASNHITVCEAYKPVAAGQNIYARAWCSNAPDTGYHVNMIGIGG